MQSAQELELSQIAELVESLYRPENDPSYIRATQYQLQKLQVSPDGWALADRLLSLESSQCQFFGALTYTVKINSLDPSQLPEGFDPSMLLNRLLQQLVSVGQNSKPFVSQKLLSTLSLFFVKFAEIWPDALRAVVNLLGTSNQQVTLTGTQGPDELRSLTLSGLHLCLQFSKILMEDLSSDNQTSVRLSQINSILKENSLPVICSMLEFIYENAKSGSIPASVLVEAVTSYCSWVSYFCGSSKSNLDVELQLQKFCPYLIMFLYSDNTELFVKSSDTIVDIYNLNGHFWPASFKDELIKTLSQLGGHLVERYQQPDYDRDDEDMEEKIEAFANLLLSYCTENIGQYLDSDTANTSSIDSHYDTLLGYLVVLTKGPPGERNFEDKLNLEILLFWSNFAEEVIGDGSLTGSTAPTINRYMTEIIGIYWEKIKLPSQQEASSWTSETWEAFTSFRRDFCDFLETAYPIVGHSLFELLVSSVMTVLDAIPEGGSIADWPTIECSFYCLNGLADMIPPHGEEYSKVKTIFSSSVWQHLSNSDDLKVRQTAVNLIGSFDGFFESPDGRPYITIAMEYLFSSLYIEDLSSIASRSIQKLCISCGQYLVELLPVFMSTYESMSLYSRLDNVVHERTVSALAHIIQNISSTKLQMEYVEKLVSRIIQQSNLILSHGVQALSDSANGQVDPAIMTRACSLLRCLVCLGKGMRQPDDGDAASEELIRKHEEAHLIWQADELNIRPKILEEIKVFSIDHEPFNEDPEICEICCDIFKAGLSETWFNPFVFDINTVITFIKTKYEAGPRCHSSLSDLSCCLITSSQKSQGISREQSLGYTEVLLALFFNEKTLSADALAEFPENQVANIKLASHIITHGMLGFLLTRPNVGLIFGFCLNAVVSADRLVLREASSFWNSFLTRSPEDVPDGKEAHRAVFQNIGPALCENIVRKISGDASRSDLDMYISTVRKLVGKYPLECKPWLTLMILERPVGNLAEVDRAARSQFLQKLFIVRGGSNTGPIIKDFWLSCRGLSNYV